MRRRLAILQCAAWLVPGDQRAEWLAEWRSELWYVWRTCNREPGAVTAFCLGAFKDALWLKRNSTSPNREMLRLESPAQCCLFLAALAVASSFIAFRLPGPRERILPAFHRDSRDLVMLSQGGRSVAPFPTIPIEKYRSLTNGVQRLFTGFAFYQPVRARVPTPRQPEAQLSIALASGNLFELLNIPVSRPRTAALILSDRTWRKYFDRDPHIVGSVLDVAGQQARVAGIISEDSWRLPGRLDAWLLDAALPPDSKGFVVAQVRTPFRPRTHYDGFDCVPVANGQPALAFLFVVVVACLILPATTFLSLGEYPADTRFRRWTFLTIKIVLILPAVYCVSFTLTYLSSDGLQAHAMLWGCVFAFRWALVDQRRRCPVCLRLLTNPTRIGRPSQNLLGWYGTELLCSRGHGLLQVPEIPTSWSGTQRWRCLEHFAYANADLQYS
jgi:hypothetical protein